MPNTLFNSLGGFTPQPTINPKMAQLMNFAKMFQSNYSCTPQQKVQELLSTGQMTQEQFNQYKAIADQFLGRTS